jgi:hypothetical protein
VLKQMTALCLRNCGHRARRGRSLIDIAAHLLAACNRSLLQLADLDFHARIGVCVPVEKLLIVAPEIEGDMSGLSFNEDVGNGPLRTVNHDAITTFQIANLSKRHNELLDIWSETVGADGPSLIDDPSERCPRHSGCAEPHLAVVTRHARSPTGSASTSNELPSGKINCSGLGNISRRH